MADDPKKSYIKDEDDNIVGVRHTYEEGDSHRDYTYTYDPGLFGLGPDNGELVDVTDHYDDGTSRSYDPGDEPRFWGS